MEASAFPASVGLPRTRIALGASLLRIRSDEQLVSLFREGNDEAFRVIHDRYRTRLFAYARQMLSASAQDPEDAVQEIFVRAYYGLRSNDRRLALRAWLYRIAHNRCIDDLRRPQPLLAADVEPASSGQDPVQKAEQRDALRRILSDVQRLPEQQRSALLMRELSGMSYADVAGALGVSIPAVKSLLVRARVSLAQASEARDTACADIRADVILSHDRGVRTSGLARRHMRDCPGCREFRAEVRGVSRQLAALAPTLGPLGLIANLLGWGSGGAAAGTGAVAGGGAAGGAAGTGAATSAGLLAGGASHVVTLLAAAVVTAGGAVEIQKTLVPVPTHRAHHSHPVVGSLPALAPAVAGHTSTPSSVGNNAPSSRSDAVRAADGSVPTKATRAATSSTAPVTDPAGATRHRPTMTELVDPDMYMPPNPDLNPSGTSGTGSSNGAGLTGSSPNTVTPGNTGASGGPTSSAPATGSGSTGSASGSSGSSSSSTGTSGSSGPVSTTGTSSPEGSGGSSNTSSSGTSYTASGR